MRKIDKIIIHCTATPAGRNHTVADIDRWHRARGFTSIGYHYVINLEGMILEGRDIALPGAHCKGHNDNSIGIAYIGGCEAGSMKPADTRTRAQRKALIKLVRELRQRFPAATVHGHNEFAAKACPSFIVQNEAELCGR